MALKVYAGTYTGNGSDNRSITGVGFEPKYVLLKEAGAAGGGSGFHTFYNGDESWWFGDNASNRTNGIQALESDGFQVGTAAWVNGSGVNFNFFCLGGDATEIVTGSYSGNATDNRSITGVGFEPEIVLVHGLSNTNGSIRSAAHSGDSSFIFMGSGTTAANGIQALESDGFQVGNDAQNNSSGVTYHYLAIRGLSSSVATGTYTGNGTDDRDVTGLGFLPEVVLIQKSVAGYNAVWSSNAHTAGTTSIMQHATANATNMIQSLDSDGFQIGTDTRVNLSSSTYYWYAFRDTPAAGASLKSINGVLKANIKSWNGVTLE